MKKRIIFRVLAMLITAVMLVSVASCTAGPSDNADNNEDTAPKTIEVPVFAVDIEFGKKITVDKVTTKTISADAVSSTMVTSLDDVVGKYVTVAVVKGNFARSSSVLISCGFTPFSSIFAR